MVNVHDGECRDFGEVCRLVAAGKVMSAFDWFVYSEWICFHRLVAKEYVGLQ